MAPRSTREIASAPLKELPGTCSLCCAKLGVPSLGPPTRLAVESLVFWRP